MQLGQDSPARRERGVGVVGARGHVGAELLALLATHPWLRIAFVGSRQLAGRPVSEVAPGCDPSLRFEAIEPADLEARMLGVDAVVLALPNGATAPYVAAVERASPGAVVVDVSTDHRAHEAWAYGLPELRRETLRGARRIANPGCYATAAQLALAPLVKRLGSPPRIFGVSGFSGAGSTPSRRNDPELLRDNLLPYDLVGHSHEREIARHLGCAVHFMPHVAPFFRGLTLTIDCRLAAPLTEPELRALYARAYRDEPLVRVLEGPDPPLVRDAVGRHEARLGGFRVQSTRAVLVATLDNLLKGAATQVVQNLNLALGLDELAGIAEQTVTRPLAHAPR
jgi:N-acetyl-gamma-glutamyl-phosphate reductase